MKYAEVYEKYNIEVDEKTSITIIDDWNFFDNHKIYPWAERYCNNAFIVVKNFTDNLFHVFISDSEWYNNESEVIDDGEFEYFAEAMNWCNKRKEELEDEKCSI